ncbi:MAG: trypsin-like peptidase domain-containing protein [Gammaproteobacteria bacterium]|nr:trypsin-like peptidase domain-containing protein [Gammaproteobacteria bacterium]
MNVKKACSFLLQSTAAGIAAAILFIFLAPDTNLLTKNSPQRTVIEVNNGPNNTAHRESTTRIAVAQPASYADAIATATPSVVNIYTSKKIKQSLHPLLERLFSERQLRTKREKTVSSLGSGVIFTNTGFVLTNYHVIKDADEIQVSLSDGRSASASLVGIDPDTDLAVLKIPLSMISGIKVNTSNNIRIGDVVFAIGNPLGIGQTVTMGIISATGRNRLGINTFENFIQTDAAINPGNSGGALINANGELIGINTLIYSKSGGSDGIGLAIPADLATDVLKQLIEQGFVTRGWLGVEAQNLSSLRQTSGSEHIDGVILRAVVRDGPADLAGLLAGDVISYLGGVPAKNVRVLREQVSKLKPGDSLEIRGYRKTGAFTTVANVGHRPTRP